MKFAHWFLICMLAGGFKPALCSGPVKPELGNDDEITLLIRQLASEKFSEREHATEQLWVIGDKAAAALKVASESEDPEVSIRAREIAGKLALGLRPDTDPEIVDLVQQYRKGTPAMKERAMEGLGKKRAWSQMLKLYAGETEPESRERFQRYAGAVAMRAARESLSMGNPAEARSYLEMAPVNQQGLLMLAWFHHNQGTWEEEFEKSKTLPEEQRHPWQLALHRAAGNFPAARDSALAAGDAPLAAWLAGFCGDPLPWLKLHEEGILGRGSKIKRAYASLAARRWLNEKPDETLLEQLEDGLSSRDYEERERAMLGLHLLGEREKAEAAFTKNHRIEAFAHFDTMERVGDALRALGLDPETPNYKGWVEERFETRGKADIEDQREPSLDLESLVALADFMEARGLHDEAWDAFSGPLTRLAKDDMNEFLDTLTALTAGAGVDSTGATTLVLRFANHWAADDADRWDEIGETLLGDGENDTWWSFAKTLAPELPPADRLAGMLALFHRHASPGTLREPWVRRLWDMVKKNPNDPEPLHTIQLIGQLSDDAKLVCDALDALGDKDNDQHLDSANSIAYRTALGQWDKAARIGDGLADLLNKRSGSAADTHALIAAMWRKTGKGGDAVAHHEKLAMSLPLGDSGECYKIAGRQTMLFDFDEATKWWKRAAICSSPDDPMMSYLLNLYSENACERREFGIAAALSEMAAVLRVDEAQAADGFALSSRYRLQADTARALLMLKDQRAAALALLESCHRQNHMDGSLADFFFPAVREAGLIAEHESWADASLTEYDKIIARYPLSHNSRNTAAWISARSKRSLDAAEDSLSEALKLKPNQPAYLDTMAEIHFAGKHRKTSVAWSEKALRYAPGETMLRRQHRRFLDGPFP